MNIQVKSSKKNNLVELTKRLQNIELIESIYIQELNTDYINMKIKYLGKINKIIDQLKNADIILKFKNDQWRIDLTINQLIFKFPFKTKYYKQDFYVSSNNFSAYKLIESWPNWPNKWLNIYGVSGSGKTHLSKILEKKLKK